MLTKHICQHMLTTWNRLSRSQKALPATTPTSACARSPPSRARRTAGTPPGPAGTRTRLVLAGHRQPSRRHQADRPPQVRPPDRGAMMFERFTDTARLVVVQAQKDARRLGHGYIGCEHLLLASGAPDEPGEVLRDHGVTRERIEAAHAHHRARPGGPAERPRQRSAGFHRHRPRRRPRPDRGGVRPGRAHPGPPGRLQEQTASLGEGTAGRAYAPPAAPPRPSQRPPARRPARQRPLLPGPAPRGHIPFTPRAKKTLELSLREADALHDSYIGVEHLILGLLAGKEDIVPVILSDLGAEATSVRAEILAATARQADPRACQAAIATISQRRT